MFVLFQVMSSPSVASRRQEQGEACENKFNVLETGGMATPSRAIGGNTSAGQEAEGAGVSGEPGQPLISAGKAGRGKGPQSTTR